MIFSSDGKIEHKRRLKILFLPAWYPTETEPIGGPFIKDQARAVFSHHDIVVLFAYPDPSPKFSRFYTISDEIEDGIRTIRVKYGGLIYCIRNYFQRLFPTKDDRIFFENPSVIIRDTFLGKIKIVVWFLTYFLSIFLAFRKLVKGGWKPDIIHAHVYTAGVPAVILRKIYKIPVIITEHSPNIATNLLTPWNQKMLRFAMNRAKLIIAVSENLKKGIEGCGVKNKFRIVPNVVNTAEFFYVSPDEKKKANRKKILMVGSQIPRKGTPYLLKALREIHQRRSDFFLDIIGDGPNQKEYEEMTKGFQLEDLVKFHGKQIRPAVINFMKKCNFFVLPSLHESFGVVIIEAMACGKPVITTDAGGQSEIVDKEVGIAVPPKDVKSLARAIEYMLDHYQNYSSTAIAKYAKERFSYEAVGKTLDKIYREVVEEKVQ